MCGVGKGSFDARDKVPLAATIVFGIVLVVLFAVAYMMCSRLSVCMHVISCLDDCITARDARRGVSICVRDMSVVFTALVYK